MVAALLGVRSVSKNMLELARLLRLNPLQRWWTIELPSSAPYLFAGLLRAIAIGHGADGPRTAAWGSS